MAPRTVEATEAAAKSRRFDPRLTTNLALRAGAPLQVCQGSYEGGCDRLGELSDIWVPARARNVTQIACDEGAPPIFMAVRIRANAIVGRILSSGASRLSPRVQAPNGMRDGAWAPGVRPNCCTFRPGNREAKCTTDEYRSRIQDGSHTQARLAGMRVEQRWTAACYLARRFKPGALLRGARGAGGQRIEDVQSSTGDGDPAHRRDGIHGVEQQLLQRGGGQAADRKRA